MTLIDSIKKFLLGKQESSEAPDGYCPNCWGRQEYGGNMYEAINAEGIGSDNIDIKKGWIQEYAEKHLLGIKLTKKENNWVCTNCNHSITNH